MLRGTGLIVLSDEKAVDEIKVVVNNTGDTGSAAAKGIGTGLTFGLVGSTVMDAYEMTVTITSNGKAASRTAIKHALYSALGNTTLPPGIEAVPPNVAFFLVVEQMLLRALQDMQKAGELTYMRFPKPLAWQFVAQG